MNTFKMKVIAALSAIIVSIIAILVLLQFNAFQNESVRLNKNILREKNHAIQVGISERLESYKSALASFSINEQDIGVQLSDSAREQAATLTRNLAAVSEGVYLFRRDGGIYDGNGNLFSFNIKELDRDYWNALFVENKSFFVSDPFKSARSGEEVLAVAYKINNNVASLVTIKLASVLGPISQRKDLFFYSSDGTILHSPYQELLGKNIHSVRPLYQQFSAEKPELTYTADVNGSDVEFTAFWSEIKISGWQYVTFLRNETIEASAHSQLLSSIGTGFASLVVAIGFMLYTLERLVVKPVGGAPDEIAALMESMAEGKISANTASTGKETGIYLSLINLSNKLSDLIRNSHAISDNVSSSANELNVIMNQTQSHSQRVLAQVEQISTAIQELSSTSNDVSDKAVQAEEAARQANDNVEQGQGSLERNITLIRDIRHSVNDSANIIAELREFSIEIGSVIEVINGISEQTNLLALNAAIEAARAGEQGRGFAVVADEVRNLASKTQQSTVSIKQIIENLQTQSEFATNNMNKNVELIEESVRLSDTVKEAFESISKAVDSISEVNTLVATASQQQHAVTEEIAGNTTYAYDALQNTVSAVEETLQAANDLSKLASAQQEELAYFQV